MAYQVEISPLAERQIRSFKNPLLHRINDAIKELAVNPRGQGCKKLVGEPNSWRTRVGDYRIIYEIHDQIVLVLVMRVDHRSTIYQRKR